MKEYPDQISKADQQTLSSAPVLVFLLLVAPSQGAAAEMQKRAFSAVIRGADQVPAPLFAAALAGAAADYEGIRSSFAGRSLDPSVELAAVCDVLDRLEVDDDLVNEFRQGLVILAEAVARAGATRGWFRRKISRGNREVLGLIRVMFTI